MRDGRIVADELFAAGLPSVRLIINKVMVGTFARNPVRDLDECIDTVGAQLIGVVPYSEELAAAAAAGTAAQPAANRLTAVDHIARRSSARRFHLRCVDRSGGSVPGGAVSPIIKTEGKA